MDGGQHSTPVIDPGPTGADLASNLVVIVTTVTAQGGDRGDHLGGAELADPLSGSGRLASHGYVGAESPGHGQSWT